MDTLLEQKLAILGQAVLIWLVSFIFHLFFTSVAWDNPLVHSLLSATVVMISAGFLLWLNMSRDKYYTFGTLVLTVVLWILICTLIDFAAHVQARLSAISLEYFFFRGWHFLVIIPAAIYCWVAIGKNRGKGQVIRNVRFIGRRR